MFGVEADGINLESIISQGKKHNLSFSNSLQIIVLVLNLSYKNKVCH